MENNFNFMIRQTNQWKAIFAALQDERYANNLITAFSSVKIPGLCMDKIQSTVMHNAYDHMIMFEATGNMIKGEDTQNTRIAADMITKYFNSIEFKLSYNTKNFLNLYNP